MKKTLNRDDLIREAAKLLGLERASYLQNAMARNRRDANRLGWTPEHERIERNIMVRLSAPLN